jgi:hypothetical protein
MRLRTQTPTNTNMIAASSGHSHTFRRRIPCVRERMLLRLTDLVRVIPDDVVMLSLISARCQPSI